jgi:hypothetical protein
MSSRKIRSFTDWDITIKKDALTMHSVSPISPVNPELEAWRDVLVIAFTQVTS